MDAKKYMDFAPRRKVSMNPKPSARTASPLKSVQKSANEKPVRGDSVVAVRIDKRETTAQKKRAMLAASETAKSIRIATPKQPSVAMRWRRMNTARPVEPSKMNQTSKKVEMQPDYEDESDSLLGVIEDLDRELATTTAHSDSSQSGIISSRIRPKTRLGALARAKSTAKPKDDRVGFVEGKSPFINVDKLEKRPLSAFRKASDRPMLQRNSYVEQVKIAKSQNDVPTMVVTKASKKSSFSLIIVILLTMALGGVVGFVTYLAFFQ